MTTEHEVFDVIRAGDAERLRALLAADPTVAGARSPRGHSAVLVAQYRHGHDLVRLLLAAGPTLDIWDAAAVGDTARVAELLDRDAGLANACSGDGFFPLGLAAFFGHTDTARLLIERGANVAQAARNPMKVQPLHSAVAGHHVEIVKLLVEAGAPVNTGQQGGWTPLQGAVHAKDVEAVRYLLDHGADPKAQNDAGQSAIGLAAETGGVELLKLLKGR
jgi:ankyrin repeat protein